MDKELKIDSRDLALQEKYPKILRDLGGDPGKTCMSVMHGGIAVGAGWIPLLEEVFRFCQFHHDKNGYPQLVADQIKEKFGTLRFYYHFEDCDSDTWENGKKFNRTDEMLRGAISFAEGLTNRICEECGAPGKMSDTRWKAVRCEACAKKSKI